jgi:hypothetical protein
MVWILYWAPIPIADCEKRGARSECVRRLRNGQAVRAIVSLGRFGSTIHTHRPGVPLEPAVEAFTIDANSKSEGFLKTCLREKSRRRETNTQTSSKKIAFVTGANKDIGFEVAHLSCRK